MSQLSVRPQVRHTQDLLEGRLVFEILCPDNQEALADLETLHARLWTYRLLEGDKELGVGGTRFHAKADHLWYFVRKFLYDTFVYREVANTAGEVEHVVRQLNLPALEQWITQLQQEYVGRVGYNLWQQIQASVDAEVQARVQRALSYRMS